MDITLSDDEVGEDDGDGVAGEDVVTTVNMFPVDGESTAAEESYHPPRYICNCPESSQV